MKLKNILEQELKIISPSKNEIAQLKKTSDEVINLLKENCLKAFVGGSLAKGTLIKKKKQDIDIFIIFKKEEEISNLEKILKKINFRGELKTVHGSRDYFKINLSGFLIEIVPVLENKDPEKAENVTDVSLSHVKYIKKEINKNPKIADEIRIAKSFCYAQKCYGAESYVKGFSGYALENLVIFFGGFVKFLIGIQKKKIIDPLKQFKNEKEILREINSSKLNSPVILVDPTYKYRNVTAGLGRETFEKFIHSAKQFFKSPSKDFFIEKKININKLKELAKKKNAVLIEIDLFTDRQEGDIAGAKMKKFFDFFCKELLRKKQIILEKEFDYSGEGKKAKGYLVVVEKKEIEIRGPPVGLEEAIKKFTLAKKETWKKKGYFWAKEKTCLEEIFRGVKKFENEMGARAEINFKY